MESCRCALWAGSDASEGKRERIVTDDDHDRDDANAALHLELLRLAQERVPETILAMARFRVGRPRQRAAGPVGWLWMVADWTYPQLTLRFPNPAYLALTNSILYVFSARFGAAARLIGPTHEWKRSEMRTKASERIALGVRVQLAPGKPIIEVEAVDPGPESARLVRLLRQEWR
jgi:hypothetical protein